MEKFYHFFIEYYTDKTILSFFDEMILLSIDLIMFLFILICCFLAYRFFNFIKNNNGLIKKYISDHLLIFSEYSIENDFD